MINNTNFAHWSRLKAKSLDTQFTNEMVTGLNCSPFEAEAIVEKVREIYTPLLETAQGLKPGQIQVTVIDASVAPNVPLAKAKQRLVTLTLHAGKEDIETRKKGSVPALRQKRLCRMCQEAFQQGGLLTLEDLANLFNCGVRTLVNDLATLRKKNIVPPLRSTRRATLRRLKFPAAPGTGVACRRVLQDEKRSARDALGATGRTRNRDSRRNLS